MTHHNFKVYKSDCVPFSVWKEFNKSKKNSYEDAIDENNKSAEAKRGCFEITSLVNSSRTNSDSTECGEHAQTNSIHLQNLNNFDQGQFHVSDFKIPSLTVHETQDRDFEFLDDNLKSIFLFSRTENDVISENIPESENFTMNSRFIVKTSKSISHDLSNNQKNIVTEGTSQNFSPVQEPMNSVSASNSKNDSKRSSCGAKTDENLIILAKNEYKTDSKKTSDKISNLNKEIMDNTSNRIQEASLDFLLNMNTNIDSEFSSKKQTSYEQDLLTQLDLINPSRDQTNINHSQTGFSPPNEIYHRSLEKVTRATFTTVSMLSNQMSNMSDYVLELNALVVQLKAENERLQRELFYNSNLSKRQQKSTYNIIQGEDNTLFLTFEIIPGLTRCINITKVLSPEEITVIRNLRKM